MSQETMSQVNRQHVLQMFRGQHAVSRVKIMAETAGDLLETYISHYNAIKIRCQHEK